MKKLHFIMFSIFIYTTSLLANPPKYHGEDPYLYVQEVYAYYKYKIKNIEQYRSQSNKIINSFKNNILKTNDPVKIKNYTDSTVKNLLDLSKKELHLDENDYKFIQNPLKFYGIDNSYNELIKAKIYYPVSLGLLDKIFENRSQIVKKKTAYTPLDVVKVLKSTYKLDKSDKELISNPKKTLYYYVLKTSDYKDFFVRDDRFIKAYVNTYKVQKVIEYYVKKYKIYPEAEKKDISKLKSKLKQLKTILLWKYKNIEDCTNIQEISIDKWKQFKKKLLSKNCFQKVHQMDFDDLAQCKKELKKKNINDIWKETMESKIKKLNKKLSKEKIQFKKDFAKEIKTIDNNILKKQSEIGKLEKLIKTHHMKHCHNLSLFLNIIKDIKYNIDKDYYKNSLPQLLTKGCDIEVKSIQDCLDHKCVKNDNYCWKANNLLLNFMEEWGYIKK